MLSILAVAMLSVLYVWAMYNIPILAVGVRHLRRVGRKGRRFSSASNERLPMVSIIVPVKDEEKVVGRLLDALLRVKYPPKKKEILIVEDGSVDKTVEICREYARKYRGQVKFVRQSRSDGKPSALNCGLKHVSGEIIAVFDADNVPEPDVLLKAVEYFDDPSIGAVQGRTCAINAGENMLTRFISYEDAVRYEAYIGGKDVLGLFVPLTGSCYFVRRSALDEVGGWGRSCLSEDMELAAGLTERGHKIKYAWNVRSWQENPARLAQLFRQRTRWFRGCLEVGLRYGRLVKKLDKRSIDAEITFAGPFMFVPCFIGYLMGISTFMNWARPGPFFGVLALGTALLTTITLFIVGVALVSVTKPRRISNLLWLPFIYAYWSVQSFVAFFVLIQILLKRPKRWLKTAKTGATAYDAY